MENEINTGSSFKDQINWTYKSSVSQGNNPIAHAPDKGPLEPQPSILSTSSASRLLDGEAKAHVTKAEVKR